MLKAAFFRHLRARQAAPSIEGMNAPFSRTRLLQFAPLTLVALSALLAVIAYAQALYAPFFSDDEIYLIRDTQLGKLPFSELWRLFTAPYNSAHEFLPLRSLSYWIDMALFGLNPTAFRLHNIVLFLLSLPLVYGTTAKLWRYFRPADAVSAPLAAAVVTALFALHPALVESVVWISSRKYILPNLFAALTLWCAVNARKEQGVSIPYAAATLTAFAAAMLSKSSYVGMAPLAALLWIIFWLDAPAQNRRYLLLLWPLAILFLGALLTKVFITFNNGFDSIPFYSGKEAVIRTLAALGWLTRLSISPENRLFYYPIFDDPYLPAMAALGGAVLLASLAGAATLLRKRSLALFALIAFFLCCLPYLQLIPHAPPSLISDRYLALAIWPAILLIVTLTWHLKPLLRIALLLAFALPLAFQTLERPRHWKSYEALLEADVHNSPGYYAPAAMKVFEVQLKHGLLSDAAKTANSIAAPEMQNIVTGLVQTEHAVANAISTGNPQDAMDSLLNFGPKLRRPPSQAQWDPTLNYIWRAYQYTFAMQLGELADKFPQNAKLRYNAGVYLLIAKRHVEAIRHLRAAISSPLLPDSLRGAAFYYLGLTMVNIGYATMAETHLQSALQQQPPDLRAHCLLATVYQQARRVEDAAHAEAACRSLAPKGEMTP